MGSNFHTCVHTGTHIEYDSQGARALKGVEAPNRGPGVFEEGPGGAKEEMDENAWFSQMKLQAKSMKFEAVEGGLKIYKPKNKHVVEG